MGTPDWMDRTVKVYNTYDLDRERSEKTEYEPRSSYERCDECLEKPCECTRF